jgi:3-oxoacyl-[acyl-carrier protein] reductase
MTSVAGLAGNRGQTNYAASKAGLIGAAKSLAQELAKRNITVNCIAPGLIETEMIEGAMVENLAAMIPMRRLGKPEEVAAVVSFLFSEGASYITGETIAVTGGML